MGGEAGASGQGVGRGEVHRGRHTLAEPGGQGQAREALCYCFLFMLTPSTDLLRTQAPQGKCAPQKRDAGKVAGTGPLASPSQCSDSTWENAIKNHL